MVEAHSESVELYVLKGRIKLEGFIRANIKTLEEEFPVQVGAAQKAAEILFRRDSTSYQDIILEERDEYNKIKMTEGFSGNKEESKAFRSAFHGLVTLRKLGSTCPSDDVRRLGEEIGLII